MPSEASNFKDVSNQAGGTVSLKFFTINLTICYTFWKLQTTGKCAAHAIT